MISDDFEWDDNKAAANAAKHGIEFNTAKEVFKDTAYFVIEDADDAYGEPRLIAIGFVGMKLLAVVYTERGKRIRIISARKANGHEQRLYHEG